MGSGTSANFILTGSKYLKLVEKELFVQFKRARVDSSKKPLLIV
jgi:hypothetical protein